MIEEPITQTRNATSLAPETGEGLLPLSISDLTVAYDRKPVLFDVDLDIPAGKLVAVIGPNGAGKSTLIKGALGLVPKLSGSVRVFGKPVDQQRKVIGYVPQRESVDWDFPVSVIEVVLMGLYGKLGWFRRPGKKEKMAAAAALEKVGLEAFAHRQISQLSGGQQQRVFLARALVQNARLYLMDEPFAGVDAATERAILVLLQQLRAEGRTVLVVHHDLQTVPMYFDHVVMLNMRVVAQGAISEVFNEANLKKTYGGKLTLLSEAAHAFSRR